MKRLTIISSIILATLSGNMYSQDFDFRNIRWGMDSLQVKSSETATYVYSRGNNLYFDGKLGNIDTRIIYQFTMDGQLFQAYYILTMNSKNPSTYVSSFLTLQGLLTSKYKDPYKQMAATINGKVISQDEWASNLISDNLNLETRWKSDRTDVILSLYSISDELNLEIRYTSLKYEKKAEGEKDGILLKEL